MTYQENRARTPIVRELIEIARASELRYVQIEKKAGISRGSIEQWARGRHNCNTLSLTCIGEALGYELKWVRK